MDDPYFALFFATGSPIFYLLHCREAAVEEEAKTAWCEPQAELV